MQITPLSADPNVPSTITLIDGTVIPYDSITFDTSNYHFTMSPGGGGNPVDITNNMYRADKLTFPNFDPVEDNYRLSYYVAGHTATVDAAGVNPLQPLDESVLGAFNANNASTFDSIKKFAAYALAAYVGIQLLKVFKK